MSDQPLRIGDAERDRAVTALAEHYAAGRLTKVEYDERSDQVLTARFDRDLDGPFADLPAPTTRALATEPATPRTTRPGHMERNRPGRAAMCGGGRSAGARFAPPVFLLFPAIIAIAIIASAPWLLFLGFCFFMIGGRSFRTRLQRSG